MPKDRCPRALAAALLLTVTLTAACDLREKICRDGEYAVRAVGNQTGRTCVKDSDDPPPGYTRFPDGQVPVHVDDEWDVYWRTH